MKKMDSRHKLLSALRRLDGRGYKAYKSLKGTYDFDQYHLLIDSYKRCGDV